MRKRLLLLTAVLCLAAALSLAEGAAPGPAEEPAEWTVLFYMCGSDLESRYGYATENLKEIAECGYPLAETGELLKDLGSSLPEHVGLSYEGRVNVLIETGGCLDWHSGELGLEISSKALQRWRYEGYPQDGITDGFHLEETLPLASMADPETLADFIRWGAENYPAKKVALVLWDHGGGSKSGIFIDEIFQNDTMGLGDLRDALRKGGVRLEAVLLDACMMANLETAYAVSEQAAWMIASEEVVAGQGTAVGDWLQELYMNPDFDGEWLGRWVCDMTQIRYANKNNEQAQQLLTWSVIDLSKVPALTRMFDLLMKQLGQVYAKYPRVMSYFAKYVINVEHYGTGDDGMWDLAGIFYLPEISMIISEEAHRKLLNALKETVVYSLRGSGRSSARGLSFCYAVDFNIADMERYCQNCPSPHYLALLDAVSPWTAPDWVYEKAERLPEMETLPDYQVKVRKVMMEDGTPALSFPEDSRLGAGQVHYNMFRRDEQSGDMVSFGTMPAYFNESAGEDGVYQAWEPWLWPALEGQHIASEVIGLVRPGATEYLGSIPIQINGERWYLRYGYFIEDNRYEVYGLWDGYDMSSGLFNRNVQSLSRLAGREYSLLYPLYREDLETQSGLRAAESKTLFRAMNIDNLEIPEGIYYFQYVVYDMFMRPMRMDPVGFRWDGKRLTLADGYRWEGETELEVPEDYWE